MHKPIPVQVYDALVRGQSFRRPKDRVNEIRRVLRNALRGRTRSLSSHRRSPLHGCSRSLRNLHKGGEFASLIVQNTPLRADSRESDIQFIAYVLVRQLNETLSKIECFDEPLFAEMLKQCGIGRQQLARNLLCGTICKQTHP